MQLIYVNMQDNYVDMQDIFVNMQDIYVDMQEQRVTDGQTGRWTDRQTIDGQIDPHVTLCFAVATYIR